MTHVISGVNRVEFVSDMMWHIKLRVCWGNITVLNARASTEHKSDDSKDRFFEELEQVVYNFPKRCTKILLGDLNIKMWREGIFKRKIVSESLH
jgi:hypothetical protein